MPMSSEFETRLYPILDDIAAHFGTPFHIYDETGIRQTGAALNGAFSALQGFREYFAVKALPNPKILQIMQALGFGFDCSSIPEIMLSRQLGARATDIMFSSNNTSSDEFEYAAAEDGCIINLDDISLVDKMKTIPELICFRYNPGPMRTGNSIIGNPVEAKYGISHDQVIDAYRLARQRGARRFGLHTMLASNTLDYKYMLETTRMLLNVADLLQRELNIAVEFVNIGGGIGIPYRPAEPSFNLTAMAAEVTELFTAFGDSVGFIPTVYMESGRYMTGPHGTLVTSAINHKNTYRKYVGVDASMADLMRPGMYGAYHHITVPVKMGRIPAEIMVDVVGSLCENNDKFAIQRPLPQIDDGDLLCIHDTGAHGHAMGFNYNGRLRSKELLLRSDGTVELIRRAETVADHFATLQFEPQVMPAVPVAQHKALVN